MSPNNRGQQQQQQQQQKEKIDNADWELHRLSATGRSFLLEPESRTGIVQELQQRLRQEQQRRHGLLLLRSANNASQNPAQSSPQQKDKGTPMESDAPASSVDQTTQRVQVPSSEDDGTTDTQELRQNSVRLVGLEAAVHTDEISQTPRSATTDKKAERSAIQEKSELSNVESPTEQIEAVKAESTLRLVPHAPTGSTRAILNKSAATIKGAASANETPTANNETVAANEEKTRPTYTKLKAIQSSQDQASVANEEAAATVKRSSIPNAAQPSTDTTAVAIRGSSIPNAAQPSTDTTAVAIKRTAITSASGSSDYQSLSTSRPELTTTTIQAARRDSDQSAMTLAGAAGAEGKTNTTVWIQKTIAQSDKMHSTMATDEKVPSNNVPDPLLAAGEATPTVVAPIPQRKMPVAASSEKDTRRNSYRSTHSTSAAEEGLVATVAQTSQRSSPRLAHQEMAEAIDPKTVQQSQSTLTGESEMRQIPNSGLTANFQPTQLSADNRSQNESSTTPNGSVLSPPPSPPTPSRPMPPCLRCLMRCLRDSDFLGSCWKSAIFELEEAFAIKEVADTATGRSGAGADGESIQPMPMRSIGGGVVYSGGEGSSMTSPQSEVNKWQALERLCNLRNGLKTCSHLTEN